MFLAERFHIRCPSLRTTHICLCTEKFVIVPLNEKGNIAFWKTNEPDKKPTILKGHHKNVSALCVSNDTRNACLLCSCSADNIILWNLQQCDENSDPMGKVLHSDTEQPLCCKFSPDDTKVAISFKNGIWILNVEKSIWVACTENLHFSLLYFMDCGIGIFGLEGNLLRVWDYEVNDISTKAAISSDMPVVMCCDSSLVVIGTSHGYLLVYSHFSLIRRIQLTKIIFASRGSDNQDFENDDLLIHTVECFHHTAAINSESCYLPLSVLTSIVTSTCLIVLNIANEDVLFFLDFNEGECQESNIGLIRSAGVHYNPDSSELVTSLIPVMSDTIVLLKIKFQDEIATDHANHPPDELSFLKTNRHQEQGDLLCPPPQISRPLSIRKNKNKVTFSDLPITFHKNVHSSGYGKVDSNQSMFRPKINDVKKSVSCKSIKNISMLEGKKFNDQPLLIENLRFLDKTELYDTPMVSSLHSAVDGAYVSCTSPDGLVNILQAKENKLNIKKTITAHLSGGVNSAYFSHSGRLLVSAGEDRSVRLWNLEKKTPLLTIERNKAKKHIFEEGVSRAQFYYLDRFLLAASRNSLHVLEYSIQVRKAGSIHRQPDASTFQLVRKIPLESHRITSFAALNQSLSNLVVCAGSSKCIDVIDMSVGKVASHIKDKSAKPSHCVALNEGSPFKTQNSSMYDLFLTATQYDGIKVWDLRANKAVLMYQEHKCKTSPCNAVFSTCGKYIVTGSEDKSVYMYDLRWLSYVKKLTHPDMDVVTGVALNCCEQLFASSLNGVVCLYQDDKRG